MSEGIAIRERPILFTTGNVNAILDGRKTQTRRIVKRTDSGRVKLPGSSKNWHLDDPNAIEACPYGKPGDRLWVRETVRKQGDVMVYAADADEVTNGDLVWPSIGERNVIPSIHMPRWACRLVLELTAVRVERLQECSELDAIAEGVKPCGHTSFHVDEHTCSYKDLWESINGEGSWALNPWVWVLTFRPVPHE